VAGILDLQQAETLLYGATKTIPDIQRQIEQTENFISILLGRTPAHPPRRSDLEQRLGPRRCRPGLPVELLARRPGRTGRPEQQLDGRQCTDRRRQGAALSSSRDLADSAGVTGFITSGLNYGPLGVLNVLPFVNSADLQRRRAPGRRGPRRGQTQEAILPLPADSQQAFREVADALVEVRKRREFREATKSCSPRPWGMPASGPVAVRGRRLQLPGVLDTERQFFQPSSTSHWPGGMSSVPSSSSTRPSAGGEGGAGAWPVRARGSGGAVPEPAALPIATPGIEAVSAGLLRRGLICRRQLIHQYEGGEEVPSNQGSHSE